MQQVRSYEMEYTYNIITAKGSISLKRTDENGEICWIPTDESNSDYQTYLKWLEESNV